MHFRQMDPVEAGGRFSTAAGGLTGLPRPSLSLLRPVAGAAWQKKRQKKPRHDRKAAVVYYLQLPDNARPWGIGIGSVRIIALTGQLFSLPRKLLDAGPCAVQWFHEKGEMMKQGFSKVLMVLLVLSASACTTASVVRGPMAVGADLGGLDGVVKTPAKP